MLSARAAACVMAVAMFCSTTVSAAGEGGGIWTVGVSGGTLGISPDVGYRFNRALGVRVNGGFYGHDFDKERDGIRYDAKARLNSVGFAVDLYPLGGSTRFSVGARANSNKVVATGTPVDSLVEIGEGQYTQAEIGQLEGKVSFRKFSPTLTVGKAGKFKSGLALGIEAGVMLQGSPKVSVSSSGSLANNSEFQADLEAERADKEDQARDYKLWPVLQLHILYRF
jgi:hypothetical protein